MKKNLIPLLVSVCIVCLISCTKKDLAIDENKPVEKQKGYGGPNGFEISYWIDIDVSANNGRGYWYHYNEKPINSAPQSNQIWAAVSRCRYSYHGTSLYVIYHRQFEIAQAKLVFRYWKQYGDQMGVKIIPTLVLEDYSTPAGVNFSDSELPLFAIWCKDSLKTDEFGVYDIYGYRQLPGTAQNTQLGIIKSAIGNKIVRVGLQPGEIINNKLLRAVEDTWTAECQGKTNALWENPVNYNGSTLYGRNLLMSWVNDRITNNQGFQITWNLIPVAWDYDVNFDPYGYVPPQDNAYTNDPPKAGRISLCHSYIVGGYYGGSSNAGFGGYSCDLHILNANSTGRGELSTSFYERIKTDQLYTGYFASGINQVAAVYDLYDN